MGFRWSGVQIPPARPNNPNKPQQLTSLARRGRNHAVARTPRLAVNIAARWACEDCCWIAGHPPVDDDSRFARNLFLPVADERLEAMRALPAMYRSEAGKVFMSRDFLSTRAPHWSFRLRSRAEHIEVYQLMKGVPPPALFAARAEKPAVAV